MEKKELTLKDLEAVSGGAAVGSRKAPTPVVKPIVTPAAETEKIKTPTPIPAPVDPRDPKETSAV